MLGKGQLSECYSTDCSRGSDYESERCILFEVREICVNGTGRRWDGVLISTHTTFRQLDFNQSLIPRKSAHRKWTPP